MAIGDRKIEQDAGEPWNADLQFMKCKLKAHLPLVSKSGPGRARL
jgi:hypothetical protein